MTTPPTPDEPCAWCGDPADCQRARCDYCDREPCVCPDDPTDEEYDR